LVLGPNVKTPLETRAILDALATQHPGADTELHYKTPFQLLVATILSAQSTDARVNMVTPALFKRYPDARALAKATAAQLEPQIHSTGFFRAKSKSLLGMAAALVEQHGGEVPATMEALVELPGVGRKTANVVLGHALGVPGLPVDRHVLRVANRIGIAESDDPVVVEQQLMAALPPERWTRTSDTLILHGRRICRPTPLCDQCVVRDQCDYFRLVIARAPDEDSRQSSVGSRQSVSSRQSGSRQSSVSGRQLSVGSHKAPGGGRKSAVSGNPSTTGNRTIAAGSGKASGSHPTAKRKKAATRSRGPKKVRATRR
jgi:endonuclease-3